MLFWISGSGITFWSYSRDADLVWNCHCNCSITSKKWFTFWTPWKSSRFACSAMTTANISWVNFRFRFWKKYTNSSLTNFFLYFFSKFKHLLGDFPFPVLKKYPKQRFDNFFDFFYKFKHLLDKFLFSVLKKYPNSNLTIFLFINSNISWVNFRFRFWKNIPNSSLMVFLIFLNKFKHLLGKFPFPGLKKYANSNLTNFSVYL